MRVHVPDDDQAALLAAIRVIVREEVTQAIAQGLAARGAASDDRHAALVAALHAVFGGDAFRASEVLDAASLSIGSRRDLAAALQLLDVDSDVQRLGFVLRAAAKAQAGRRGLRLVALGLEAGVRLYRVEVDQKGTLGTQIP